MTMPKGFKEREKEKEKERGGEETMRYIKDRGEKTQRYIKPSADASPPPHQGGRQQQQQYKLPGQDEKNAGKFFIIIGILITVFSFLFDGSLGWSILGFFLSILGTALYAHGNRKQGNDTTIVGGGFASFDS